MSTRRYYDGNLRSSSRSGGGCSIGGIIATIFLINWAARVFPPFGAWLVSWGQYINYHLHLVK